MPFWVSLPWHNGSQLCAIFPNWLTHCPLFSFRVPRSLTAVCVCSKHHYLSWEHAKSQLKGWSAAEFVCFVLQNFEKPVWGFNMYCRLHKQPTPPKSSTRLIALTLWCFSSNTAFTVVAWPPPSLALEVYRRPPDLRIRQHPLLQPLLTTLCESKLNQMCVWRLIFTTPSHSASISMLCGVLKSESFLPRHNYVQLTKPKGCCKCTNWYIQINVTSRLVYVEIDASREWSLTRLTQVKVIVWRLFKVRWKDR